MFVCRCIVQPAKRGDQRHCAIKNHDHVLGQDGRGHLWLGQVGARLAGPWPLATAPQLHQARPSAASIATAPRFAIKGPDPRHRLEQEVGLFSAEELFPAADTKVTGPQLHPRSPTEASQAIMLLSCQTPAITSNPTWHELAAPKPVQGACFHRISGTKEKPCKEQVNCGLAVRKQLQIPYNCSD